MKNLSLVLICCAMFALPASAQDVVMTFTAGVSPQQTPASNHIFVNRSSPRNEFTFDLAQVKASYFVGVGARYDVNPFFFAAEAQYNRREYVYNLNYTFGDFGRSEVTEVYGESMNVINVPLSIGVDIGLVDITSGFLPQIIVSHQSDLSKLEGYSDKLSPIRLGWHSGVAYRLNQMSIGVNWQMDFNNYADHAYVGNQNLELQGRSNRFLGTLSYQF